MKKKSNLEGATNRSRVSQTDAAPKLLVAGGAMRSGTTLLHRLLATHPQIRLMALELRALRYADLATWAHVVAVHKHFTSKLDRIRHKEFRGQLYRYLSHMTSGSKLREPATLDRIHNAIAFALGGDTARYVGDKYPDYVLSYPQFIHRPNTTCIFIYRDARDVVASLVERIQRGPWRHRRWARKYDSVDKATTYWLEVMQAMSDIQRLESNALIVRYEDLVMRTNNTIAAIAQHLQLPAAGFDPTLPDPSSIGRYRDHLRPDEVRTIERRAGPMMKAWSYPLDIA